MRTWYVYESATGLFTGQRFTFMDQAQLAANLAPGFSAVEGHVDPVTQRVNLATGLVEVWRSPPPSYTHEWDAESGAWVIPPAARRAAVQRQIDALESRQLRPLRELAIDPHDRAARDRVAAIDEQIAALRATLT